MKRLILFTAPEAFCLGIDNGIVKLLSNGAVTSNIEVEGFTVEKAITYFKEIKQYYQNGGKGDTADYRENLPAWRVENVGKSNSGNYWFQIEPIVGYHCQLLFAPTVPLMIEHMVKVIDWLESNLIEDSENAT